MSERRWASAISKAQTILMLMPDHPDALALLRYALQQKDPPPVYAASRQTASSYPAGPSTPTVPRTKSLLVAAVLEAIGFISPIQGLGHFYMGNRRLGSILLGARLLLSLFIGILWSQVVSDSVPYSIFTILPFFDPSFFGYLMRYYGGLAAISLLAGLVIPVVSQILVTLRFRPMIQQANRAPTAPGAQKTRLQMAALLEAVGLFLPIQGLGQFYMGRRGLGVAIFLITLVARIFIGNIYLNLLFGGNPLIFPIKSVESILFIPFYYSNATALIALSACASLLVPIISLTWFVWQSRRHSNH